MDKLSRRGLLTLWRRRPRAKLSSASPKIENAASLPAPRTSYFASPAPEAFPCGAELTSVVRPPGALPEDQFLNVCQRCGKCTDACPVHAITPFSQGPAEGTPHINTRQSPCQLCSGLQCTHACPSGALRPLTNPRDVRMGIAEIDTAQCLAYRGAPCRICVEVCPLTGVLKFALGSRNHVPVPDTEPCVGCGLCHRYCPVPTAIRIVPCTDDSPRQVRIVSRVSAPPVGK
jgi:ferredoxin-type protein NapG